jgi:hypothetical protein
MSPWGRSATSASALVGDHDRRQVKLAMIVAYGPTLDRDKTGWHAETWARCDLSEFPDAVMDAHGINRWSDRDGRPVPTYQLSSGPGPSIATGRPRHSCI